MSWWKRKAKVQQAGSVLYRGRWPARPEDYSFLERHGVSVRPSPRDDSGGWTAELDHSEWGAAKLVWQAGAPVPPATLVDFDPRLTPEEKALARQAGSALSVICEARSGNVLRDRKDLLRFLRAVMGDDGLCAIDHIAQSFWSRDELDAELGHDAELDIDAIHTVHLVTSDEASPGAEQKPVFWAHSHGLKELGFHDFDVLNPSRDLFGHASDLLRALAFATVEERLTPGGKPVPLMGDGVVVGVEARKFLGSDASSGYPQWRGSIDEEHLDGHLIVCDPAQTGFFSRLFGRTAPRPARALRGALGDRLLIMYSTTATDLMARRAQQMLPVLRALTEELVELELPTLVKLGYPTDDGESREHLWFEVHGFEGDSVNATLLNAPFSVSQLEPQVRARHPVDLLSDWSIMTPIGPINPRSTRVLRTVRSKRDELVSMLRQMRSASASHN